MQEMHSRYREAIFLTASPLFGFNTMSCLAVLMSIMYLVQDGDLIENLIEYSDIFSLDQYK